MDKLKYYLGVKLKVQTPYGFRPNGKESTGKPREAYLTADLFADIEQDIFNEPFKPFMRPLTSLTKEITVEGYNMGEPFVPISHLGIYKDWYGLKTWMENPNGFTFEEVNLLTQWHFWIFDQSLFRKSLIEIE